MHTTWDIRMEISEVRSYLNPPGGGLHVTTVKVTAVHFTPCVTTVCTLRQVGQDRVESLGCSPMMLRWFGDDCWPLEDLEAYEMAVP